MPRNRRSLTAASLLALTMPLLALAPASAGGAGGLEPPSSARGGGPFVSQTGTQVSGPNTFPRDLVVAPNGRRAYQLDDDRLAVLDVTRRPSPVVARQTVVFGSDIAIRRDSRWAYVVNDERLQVVDVSKQRPRRVRDMSASVPSDARDVAVSPNGKHLYIAYGELNGGGHGVRVMSLANPAKPKPVARVGTGTLPSGIAVSGDNKRVVTANLLTGTVSVINTSTPSRPKVIRKELDVPFDVEAVAMVGSTAYLWGTDDSRLAVVGAGRGSLNRIKNLAPGNDGGGYIAVSGDKRFLLVTHDQQPDDRILTIVRRDGLQPVQAFQGTSFPGGLDTADAGPAKGDLFVVAGTGLSRPEGFFPFARVG